MSDGKKGCFKIGCFGCLTVIGLGVGVVLLIGAIQISTDWGDPTPLSQEASHDLPAMPPLPELTAFPGSEEQTPITIAPLPEPIELSPNTVAGGRLELDLNMGDFTVVPGPPGENIRIEADYDSNSFNLIEKFEQRSDGGWTYKVSFTSRGGFFGMLFRGGVKSGDNRIKVIVPRDHPIEIVGKLGMGESEIDLGGLWIRKVDLELGMGDHFLDVSEPMRFAMDSFDLESSMGAIEVRNLGNASPATIDVEHSMGEIFVDLEGEWQNDSQVTVGFGMGECKLWLPDNANIDLERVKVSMGDRRLDIPEVDLPPGAPTLVLNLTGSMGELTVKR